jgi:post-segregation antitoxin (ccd killing protein)
MEKVRALATKHNCVLVFDEISAGFRLTLGGAHLLYGVDPDIAALTQHLEAYSSTDEKDIVEARAAAETALRSLLLKRNWKLPTDPLLGAHVNIKELWNKATTQGSGVRALSDVFLRELEVGNRTAFEAIEKRLGKRLTLPTDAVSTKTDALLQYYQRLEQSQPDTFIADRLVPHMDRRPDGSLGRTRDVVSISTPISKMLLSLQTTEEAKAMLEEGISAELPPTFSLTQTSKEFETFLGDVLLNAAKVAEGKNRDGSKKIASNRDILERARTLSTHLSPQLLEAAYEEAKKITKEEWKKEQEAIGETTSHGNYAALDAPPHPNEFTMLQAAFTYILLDKVGFVPALDEITGGTFTKPLVVGARHADEVAERLQSLELNESTGQKRLIIETFINTLPDTVEDIVNDPAAHNLPTD